MKQSATIILKEKGIRITKIKIKILGLFLESKKAYSLTEAETKFRNTCDRSTIFRTLQAFTRRNILEQFIDSKGVGVYVLHEHENQCTENNHYHFKCNDCESIIPLPRLPENYLTLLGNSTIKSLNLFVEGTCEDCQTELNENK